MLSINSNRFLNTLMIVGLLQFFFSCETLREIDIPLTQNKLVIGGAFASDSIMEVTISTSKFILDQTPIYESELRIKNATVNIKEEGKLIDHLTYITDDNYDDPYSPAIYKSSSEFKPQIGKFYEIEVHSNGFTSAYGSTFILPRITINSAEIEKRNITISNDYTGFPVSIEFDDPKNEKNYYRVEASSNVTYLQEDGQPTSISSSITSLGYRINQGQDLSSDYPFFPALYISDESFDGQKYTLDFFVDAINLDESTWDWIEVDYSVNVNITLEHITKEHYDFGITADLQSKLRDDPFSEPVPLKSNITGGLGIFAGYSYDLVSLELK